MVVLAVLSPVLMGLVCWSMGLFGVSIIAPLIDGLCPFTCFLGCWKCCPSHWFANGGYIDGALDFFWLVLKHVSSC